MSSLLSGDWVGILTNLLLALVPPSLFLWLWREMTAHSLYLYGQRIATDTLPRFRFAIQNNEDVALEKHTICIRVRDQGRFINEDPQVTAGCSRITAKASDDGREWRLTFDELPAYDTWTIECTASPDARNVSLDVEERDDARLSGNHLFLAADQISTLVGRRTATEWLWAFLVIVLAMATYAVVLYFLHRSLSADDWMFMLVTAAFGLLVYAFSRVFSPRVSAPLVQGYLDRHPAVRE